MGARIRDKDGGVSEYTASVTVNNVAPAATFLADPAGGIVDEGNDIVLSLTDHADPSSADTTAGFEFAFDCGDGTYSDFTGTGTLSCPAADNGPSGQQLDVGGKIRDKDGGVTEYRAGVIVLNVAPSATFGAPVSVNEGSPIGLSLTDPSDPSSGTRRPGSSSRSIVVTELVSGRSVRWRRCRVRRPTTASARWARAFGTRTVASVSTPRS